MRQAADLWLALAIGAVFLATAIAAAGMDWQAAVLPLMLSLAGVGLSAALVWSLWRKPVLKPGPLLRPGDLGMFLWFLGAALSITLLGFELGGFLFAFAFFRLSGGFGWLGSLVLAAPVPLVAWVAFDRVLGQRGFEGLVLGRFL